MESIFIASDLCLPTILFFQEVSLSVSPLFLSCHKKKDSHGHLNIHSISCLEYSLSCFPHHAWHFFINVNELRNKNSIGTTPKKMA